MSNAATPRFPRGAFATPAHILFAADPYSEADELRAPLSEVAYVPQRLSYWGNDRYGVCVTSEEAFAKATYQPEIFIPDDVVISWARARGVLNGASLDEVLDSMRGDGFKIGSQRYDDGRKLLVDYANEEALKSALSQGPVKIAMAADALPSGAGSRQGWYAIGGPRYRNTDHCVALCGFGSAEYLYQRLGVAMPSAVAGRQGYLLFTWSTIGFVDHQWLLGTCQEAWLRDPTTVGVPPLPEPNPPPVPDPTPTPDPVPPSPPVPPVPVPQQIVVTGDVTIPLWGPPRGEIVASLGSQSSVFVLKPLRGRTYRVMPKNLNPKPRPKKRGR